MFVGFDISASSNLFGTKFAVVIVNLELNGDLARGDLEIIVGFAGTTITGVSIITVDSLVPGA